MKEKMLYLMNVDWNWIKQRPHFIAEELSQYYDLTVLYFYQSNRKSLQNRDDDNIRLIAIHGNPSLEHNKILRRINDLNEFHEVRRFINEIKPDYLFLTIPKHILAIPKTFSGKVVYDCMDNHPEFTSNIIVKNHIIHQEAKLIKDSDLVLVSAESLNKELQIRYTNKISKKTVLIRNAYSENIIDFTQKSLDTKKKDTYQVCYFGTISHWFNFEYLIKSLNEFPKLEFVLMGPIDNVIIPKHERLLYKGIIEHAKLRQETEAMDCFVMPFKLNKLITSVDPVKFYEYINFNKNILSIRYSEIERFDKFVYFYDDYESFRQQLLELMQTNTVKYSDNQRKEFLRNNTWKSRVSVIKKCIDELK